MLVVPWLAVQAFTRLRKGGLKAPGHVKLLAWNDRVIAAMRRHGPWVRACQTTAGTLASLAHLSRPPTLASLVQRDTIWDHYTTQWDTRRHRHAVFAQRCAGPPYERNGLRSRSLAVRTWPPLWDEANVARQASHSAPTACTACLHRKDHTGQSQATCSWLGAHSAA